MKCQSQYGVIYIYLKKREESKNETVIYGGQEFYKKWHWIVFLSVYSKDWFHSYS